MGRVETVCVYCGKTAYWENGTVTCVDVDGCGYIMDLTANLDAYEKIVEEYGPTEAQARLAEVRERR